MTDFEHQGRTDRLETILQAILDTQQTGTLNLERGKGGVRESGTLILLYGQVFEANAGGRSGTEALKWLRTWGTCQYIFLPKEPSDIVALPPAPPTPAGATSSTVGSTNSGPAVSLPPAFVAQQAAGRTTDTRRLQYTPPPAIPPAPITPDPAYQVRSQSQNTGPLAQEPQISRAFPVPAQPVPSGVPGQSFQDYQPFQSIPPGPPPGMHVPRVYRLVDGSEALTFMDRVGLTRQHRHIFLLLDGQRSASDLVRLTRRPLDEVQHLLKDLERYGLIKQE